MSALLACTEPLMHLLIAACPPEGAVPTGMRAHDSVIYLQSMKAVESGFEMPFAGPDSRYGSHHPRYFVVPNFILYAALGALAYVIGADYFFFLGGANAIGAFLYLMAVFCFLREAVPRLARGAFILFTLGGGLGGVAYLLTGALGLHGAAHFDEYFRRFALYELLEGPHLLPFLHFQRIYYTLPLFCCYGALALLLRSERQNRHASTWPACFLLAVGTFINMRYGPIAWAIAVLCLLDRPGSPRKRTELAVFAAMAVAVGVAAGMAAHWAHPRLLENAYHTVRQAMWLSPFVCAAALHALTVPGQVATGLWRARGGRRMLGFAACGYLAVFVVLFVAYQAYYGNVLIARDAAVALTVSDWAFAGALLGVAAAWYTGKSLAQSPHASLSWVILWFLTFTAAAVSAFAQGRFLGFSPQRLMVFIWLPLCILSAETLLAWRAQHRRAHVAVTVLFVTCGVSSILVSALFFHAPVGRAPGTGPFAWLHTEVMTQSDAELLHRIEAGRVLAPMPWGDIVSLRSGVGAVHGVGALQADVPYLELEAAVAKFFSPGADEVFRRRFLQEQQVRLVFCPDTFPVEEEVKVALRATPWLRVVAESGQGLLFESMLSDDRHGEALADLGSSKKH